jgi:hypothetical protein
MHMGETTFSHQKANSPEARYCDGGLRSFFVYRDTGVTAATNGKVLVQLVRAARKSAEAKGGTGFHLHTADVHVVYMVRGWARFDYDGVDTLGRGRRLRPSASGDRAQPLRLVGRYGIHGDPGDFATTEITPPALAAAAPPAAGR